MELHDASTALNAKPDETIYSKGMVMVYALEERMSVGLKSRYLMVLPTEYEEGFERETRPTLLPGREIEEERTTHVNVINIKEMREKIERTRKTDELNLLRLYITNKQRRKAIGMDDYDTPEMKKLMEKHEKEIISEIVPEIQASMNWTGSRRTFAEETAVMSGEMVMKEFKNLMAGFEVSDETAHDYEAKTANEKMILGIKFNIAKLTETYARANYGWYASATSKFSNKHKWYEAVNELLVHSGLTRDEAGKMVELAKREERGRRFDSVVKPEVFEAIAYCLKPRAERLDAEHMRDLFEIKRMESGGDAQ